MAQPLLPKSLSCRLGADDFDIQQDLMNVSDRTSRIKEIYRLGLQAERQGVRYEIDLKKHIDEGKSIEVPLPKPVESPIQLIPADDYTRSLYESKEAKQWLQQAGLIPAPVLYTK